METTIKDAALRMIEFKSGGSSIDSAKHAPLMLMTKVRGRDEAYSNDAVVRSLALTGAGTSSAYSASPILCV
jgi:hypothetical protein